MEGIPCHSPKWSTIIQEKHQDCRDLRVQSSLEQYIARTRLLKSRVSLQQLALHLACPPLWEEPAPLTLQEPLDTHPHPFFISCPISRPPHSYCTTTWVKTHRANAVSPTACRRARASPTTAALLTGLTECSVYTVNDDKSPNLCVRSVLPLTRDAIYTHTLYQFPHPPPPKFSSTSPFSSFSELGCSCKIFM